MGGMAATSTMTTPRTNSGLASTLRISVMRLARRMRNERDANDDMSASQLSALFALARRGTLSIGDLAAEEKVQPPSMTRTVGCLAEKGLVRRDADESDRRMVVISLTDEGVAMVEESRRRKELWLHERLIELTPAERQILREAAPILEALSRA
jgi:DNA-binding MarR family transcriptional regulator